jgi:hypothetical protein
MTGDDRARHCAQCNLDVYNFSEMTEREIKTLLANREGRLCGRFYRRVDGTMLTRDCPVGFHAVVQRVSRIAGAALSAVMSVGFAAAQTPQKAPALAQIAPTEAGIEVVVIDQSGAVITNAQISVADEKGAEIVKGVSDARGEYRSPSLSTGSYVLSVSSFGFRTYKQTVSVQSHEALKMKVELAVGGASGALMGVIAEVRIDIAEPTSSEVPDFLPVPPAPSPTSPPHPVEANRPQTKPPAAK